MEGLRRRHIPIARLRSQGALHPTTRCVRARLGQERLGPELLLLLLLILDLLKFLRGFNFGLLLTFLTHLLSKFPFLFMF